MIDNDYCNIFKNAVGSKIRSLEYLLHYSEGARPNIIAVRIGFSGLPQVIIKCGSDGESLQVLHGILEEMDLGDFGRLEVVDSIKVDPASLSFCVDAYVKRVALEIGDGRLKAIGIECEDKKAFFSNVGDALNFDETRFQKMLAEEGWGMLTTISYPLEQLTN